MTFANPSVGGKSCDSCKHRVPGPRVQELLGTDYGGVDYCEMKGIPLGSPAHDVVQLADTQIQLGSSCDVYAEGVPRTSGKIMQRTGNVGTVPVFINTTSRAAFEAPKNCQDCGYFVAPRKVRKTFGWPTGTCLAKGELLPPRRYQYEAKDCDYGYYVSELEARVRNGGEVGWDPPNTDIDISDFVPLPVFGFDPDAASRDPEKAAKMPAKVSPGFGRFVEPTLYVSDAPVSDQDRAEGIAAWRKITHPTLGERKAPLFLPVFDPEFFDPDERAKIPQTGDPRLRPELYADYGNLLWYASVNMAGLGHTPVLIGHAGTGKTEYYSYLAWLCQLPFDRISISASSEIYDILGKHLVETDPATGEAVTVWQDGRLPKRWRKPGVLVIDEPNAGPPDLWQAIRPLTDNASQLVLDQDKGQVVERHPWCLFGMAMNPAWDPRYIGVNELNEADGNRLGAISIDYPPEDVERNIIISKCNAAGYEITSGQLDKLVDIGNEIRGLADPTNGGEITVSWGVRLSIKAALYTQFLTLGEAFAMAIADRLDPDQRTLVLSVVKSHDDEVGV